MASSDFGRILETVASMPITILCPKLSCRAILRVPDQARGQRVRCCSCGTAFLVPQKRPPKKETTSITKSGD